MKCTHCESHILDDCRYCPQCGQATALSPEPKNGRERTLEFPVAPVNLPVEKTPVAAFETQDVGAQQNAIALSGTLAASASLPQDALDNAAIHGLLTQANLLRVRGKWGDAVDRCVSVLRAQPGNHTAHSLLGDIYRDQGKMEDAIQWYRMAVDLHPNPSDEAKLKKLEREHAQSVRGMGGALSRPFNGPRVLLPVTPDGSLPTGTAALMGISPRSWLRGLTLTSLAFLALVLILLMGMVNNQRKGSPVPQPMPLSQSVTNMGEILPPPNISGAAQTGGAMPVPEHLAGQGLPPDNFEAGTPANRGLTRPQENQEQEQPDEKPLPTAPISGASATGSFSVPFAASPPAPAEAPSLSALANSIALPGGMRVAQIVKAPGGGAEAEITLALPARTLTAPSRSLLIRSLYRAARAVFNADTSLARVSLSVQTDRAAGSETSLLSAELDRLTALQNDPENTSMERLEASLRALVTPSESGDSGTESAPADTSSPDNSPQ